MSMLHEHRDASDEVRSTIRGPVELVCLDLVLYELQRLTRSGERTSARLARLALQVMTDKVETVQAPLGPREVDLSIALYALEEKGRTAIATADKHLLELCSKNRIGWIRPRGRKSLLTSWMDA